MHLLCLRLRTSLHSLTDLPQLAFRGVVPGHLAGRQQVRGGVAEPQPSTNLSPSLSLCAAERGRDQAGRRQGGGRVGGGRGNPINFSSPKSI